MKVHGTVALVLSVIFGIVAAIISNIAFDGGAWVPFLSMTAVMMAVVTCTAYVADETGDMEVLIFCGAVAAVVGAFINWVGTEGVAPGSYGIVVPWVAYGFGVATYFISGLVQMIAEDW